MQIPILRIPFSGQDREFLHSQLTELLDSGFLSMGKYTAEFEEAFAEYTGARYALSCSNGTFALELILRGLGISWRSVIVPTNTFLATAFAVIHSGNRVVFADSDPDTLCLDFEDVKSRITEDTAAVILVHIGGIISPAVDNLRRLCADKGIYLIEDAAHAHGCSIDGRSAGTLGVAGAFSFFPTKVLTTGEGGMVVTNDEELMYRMKMLRNHGKNPELGNRMSEMGYNYRLSEITALLGVQQVRKANVIAAERQRVAVYYDQALAHIPNLRAVALPENVCSTYYKYAVYLEGGLERSTIKKRLKEEFGVSLTGEVYADLCHTEPVWDRYTYCGMQRHDGLPAVHRWPSCSCSRDDKGFPGAEYISNNHICLPVYPGLTEAELEYVVTSLRKAIVQ